MPESALGHSDSAQRGQLTTKELLSLQHPGDQDGGLEVVGVRQSRGSQHFSNFRRDPGLRVKVHPLEVVEDQIEIIQLPQQRSFIKHPVSLRRAPGASPSYRRP